MGARAALIPFRLKISFGANRMANDSRPCAVVIGANGRIGQHIVPVLESQGFFVGRVSSKVGGAVCGSMVDFFDRNPGSENNAHVIYLSYVKNPLKNALLILRACLEARRYRVRRFFYFSTFAHDPEYCGLRRANRWPRFRSIVTFYNMNKFFAEIWFVVLAKVLFRKRVEPFVVLPGFVIGEGMIWTDMLREFCGHKNLVCPPVNRKIPTVDVHEMGEALGQIIKSGEQGELRFEKSCTVRELLEMAIKGTTIALPNLIECHNVSEAPSNTPHLPRELFFFAK